jgi:colicin import membrane protein
MDELRESSWLFSIEGLMETERDRVRREAREAQERRETEMHRVAEAAERRAELAKREREARERREALAKEREQHEHERIEALKQATIERARIEAEASLRLVEAEQARKHDLALSRIREQEGAARYRLVGGLGIGALSVALLGAAAAYFGWIAPAQARAEQHWESRLHEAVTRAEVAELALKAERAKSLALEARVPHIQAGPGFQPAVVAPTPPPARVPVRRTRVAAPQGGCKDSGDPLDNCLR